MLGPLAEAWGHLSCPASLPGDASRAVAGAGRGAVPGPHPETFLSRVEPTTETREKGCIQEAAPGCVSWHVPLPAGCPRPRVLVLSAEGFPGLGWWGEDKEAFLIWGWQTGPRWLLRPSSGSLGGGRDPVGKEVWPGLGVLKRGGCHEARLPPSLGCPGFQGAGVSPGNLARGCRDPGQLLSDLIGQDGPPGGAAHLHQYSGPPRCQAWPRAAWCAGPLPLRPPPGTNPLGLGVRRLGEGSETT